MFGFDILPYGLMVSSALCRAQRGGWPVRRAPTFTAIAPEVNYFLKSTQGSHLPQAQCRKSPVCQRDDKTGTSVDAVKHKIRYRCQKPRPEPSQAGAKPAGGGFGLAHTLAEPEPCQARPKPGLLGQAGPTEAHPRLAPTHPPTGHDHLAKSELGQLR
jgi:hypothetical protein